MHSKVKTQLEKYNVAYAILQHNTFGTIRSAFDLSHAAGIPLSQIAKTLFVKSQHNAGYGMAVLPAASRANLQAIAQALGSHTLALASEAELAAVTGYRKYGTTAIGADVPTVVHQAFLNEATIYIATGEPGEELQIAPHDLIKITQAKTAHIVATM